jgi:hypothetical protein
MSVTSIQSRGANDRTGPLPIVQISTAATAASAVVVVVTSSP